MAVIMGSLPGYYVLRMRVRSLIHLRGGASRLRAVEELLSSLNRWM